VIREGSGEPQGGAPVIRVAVADDQALFRAGFRVLLEPEDDLELAGEAGDGRAAVELARRERPDVVLMDVRMPVMDGIEATRAIAADPSLAGVRVVILTTYELDDYVFDGLRAGASGFGEALLSPGATRRLIADLVARPDHRATPAPELVVFAYQSGLVGQIRSRPT
jgi:DNA-binding NarL/FixJ family response regulator